MDKITIKFKETLRVNASLTLGYDEKTGKLSLQEKDGTILSEIDLPIEKILTNAYYDDETKVLVLNFENSNEVRIPIDFTGEIEKAISDFETKINEILITLTKESKKEFEILDQRLEKIEYPTQVYSEDENEEKLKIVYEDENGEQERVLFEEINSKFYNLELIESSWVRIAKIKNIKDNSSAIFTLNCYGNSQKGGKIKLTSSIFSLSCKLDKNKNLVVDVLPISHIPNGNETSGSGSGSSNVGASSGATSGTSGSGNNGEYVYGLMNIKVEKYLDEVFVIGLFNYPNIDLYSSLDVELLIENNINIDYLEELESVDITAINEQKSSLIEGTQFKQDNDYNFILKANLKDLTDCFDNQVETKITLNDDVNGKSYELLELKQDGSYNINGTISEYGSPYGFGQDLARTNMFKEQLNILSTGGGIKFDFVEQLNNTYGIVGTGTQWSKLKLLKISGKLILNAFINEGTTSANFQITINGEEVYNNSSYDEDLIVEYDLKDIIVGKDKIEVTGSFGYSNGFFLFDQENTDVEFVMPYRQKETLNITDINITNNDLYKFSLSYAETFVHKTSEDFKMYSFNNSFNELEKEINEFGSIVAGVEQKIIGLDGRVENLTTQVEENLDEVSKIPTIEEQTKILYSFTLSEIPDNYLEGSSIQNGKYDFVENIGTRAFYNCINLKNLILGEKLNKIGVNALEDCLNLRSLTIPKTNILKTNGEYYEQPQFEGLFGGKSYIPSSLKEMIITNGTSINMLLVSGFTNLETLILPDTIETIESYAFDNLEKLKSMKIPNKVTRLENGTFRYCFALENVEIPDSVSYIGQEVFKNCTSLKNIKLPKDLKKMGMSNFENCLSLTNVIIPENFDDIPSETFFGCRSLENITIPNSVTSIGESAFNGCSSIENLEIPNSVKTIGYKAFRGMSELRSIKIGSNVNDIKYTDPKNLGTYLLDGAGKLESIIVDENNTTYDSRDNCNALIETESNILIRGCNNTVIPNNVTILYDKCFESCTFENITIPSSIKEIKNSAFQNCQNLQTITIPKISINSHYIFGNCINLKTFYFLGSGMVGTRIFENCTSLTDIYLFSSILTSIVSNTFENSNQGINIHVRPELVESYNANTKWKTLIDSGQVVIVGDITE